MGLGHGHVRSEIQCADHFAAFVLERPYKRVFPMQPARFHDVRGNAGYGLSRVLDFPGLHATSGGLGQISSMAFCAIFAPFSCCLTASTADFGVGASASFLPRASRGSFDSITSRQVVWPSRIAA